VQTLFSTSNVHSQDRFDYWHSVACKTIVDHDSRPKCRGTFQAELQWGTLDDLELVLFANSPMDISNPRATADQLFVCRQMAGEVALEQNSRELILEGGDITLIDPLVPCVGRFFSGSKLLVLKIPRRRLEAHIGKTRQMIARRIRPITGENSLLSAFFRHTACPCGHVRRRGGKARRESGARPDCHVVCEGDGGRHASGIIRPVGRFVEPSRCRRGATCRPGSQRGSGGCCRRSQCSLRECRTCTGGHIDHASHSSKMSDALPTSAGRPVARPPDD
jgi:hypothetical protein